jgi:rhamnosyltransferase
MSSHVASVQIILSTYNGEKYLPDFIKSIESLDFTPLSILVRDDLSSDKTLEIINHWATYTKHKLDIEPLKSTENLGWKHSFDQLIRHSFADIIFFADQDDVWYPNKIKSVVESMGSNDGPVLVVHNANIINGDNLLIGINKLLGFDSLPASIENSQNITGGLYGCCIAVNRKLIDSYIDCDYGKNLGHDCVLTILALILGCVIYIDEPLISWRSHLYNSSYKVGFFNRFKQLNFLWNISKFEVFVSNKQSKVNSLKVLYVFLMKLKFLIIKKISSKRFFC